MIKLINLWQIEKLIINLWFGGIRVSPINLHFPLLVGRRYPPTQVLEPGFCLSGCLSGWGAGVSCSLFCRDSLYKERQWDTIFSTCFFVMTVIWECIFEKLGSFAVWTICDDFCFGSRNMLKTSSDDHYCWQDFSVFSASGHAAHGHKAIYDI